MNSQPQIVVSITPSRAGSQPVQSKLSRLAERITRYGAEVPQPSGLCLTDPFSGRHAMDRSDPFIGIVKLIVTEPWTALQSALLERHIVAPFGKGRA